MVVADAHSLCVHHVGCGALLGEGELPEPVRQGWSLMKRWGHMHLEVIDQVGIARCQGAWLRGAGGGQYFKSQSGQRLIGCKVKIDADSEFKGC